MIAVLLRGFGRVAVVVLCLGAVTAVSAYTVANTVPVTHAGDGIGPISGYSVSGINYSLDSSNPQDIDSVSFMLSAAPAGGATMRVQLSTGGAWYICTNAGTSVSCATTAPQATAIGATRLTLVVAD